MDANQWTDEAYAPIGGVNQVDNPSSLEPTEVADSRNFLFERNMFFTRPGVATGTAMTGGIANAAEYAKGFDGPGLNILTTSNDLIYKFTSAGVATAVTGPAVSFADPQFIDSDLVNNVILITCPGGMLRWDYGAGNVYTQLGAATRYRFVRAHLARAVAAHNPATAAGTITFAWSVAGDETTWTGSTNGSGSAIIADADSPITGLEVLHNVVAVFRYSGIHLAYPTGIAVPAFRLETWGHNTVGNHYPESLCSQDNVAFFIGPDDVYMFDLVKLTAIGRKIRKRLFDILRAGTRVKGWITRYVQGTGNALPMTRYHLLTISASPTHFIYTPSEDKWSVHDYAFTPTTALDIQGTDGSVTRDLGPSIIDNSSTPKLYTWSNTNICERASTLTGRLFYIGPRDLDMLLHRIMLGHQDITGTSATFTVTSRLNKDARSRSSSAIALGNLNDAYWVRTWFDMLFADSSASSVVGQAFQPSLSIPAGQSMVGDYMMMRFQPSGDYRGS